MIPDPFASCTGFRVSLMIPLKCCQHLLLAMGGSLAVGLPAAGCEKGPQGRAQTVRRTCQLDFMDLRIRNY
jgi:hypothetical protein